MSPPACWVVGAGKNVAIPWPTPQSIPRHALQPRAGSREPSGGICELWQGPGMPYPEHVRLLDPARIWPETPVLPGAPEHQQVVGYGRPHCDRLLLAQMPPDTLTSAGQCGLGVRAARPSSPTPQLPSAHCRFSEPAAQSPCSRPQPEWCQGGTE